MSLTNSDIMQLRRIITAAEKLLAKAGLAEKVPRAGQKASSAKPSNSGKAKRNRRTGKELLAFRKMLKGERKRGVPVAQIAKAHGVSSAYIYQL